MESYRIPILFCCNNVAARSEATNLTLGVIPNTSHWPQYRLREESQTDCHAFARNDSGEVRDCFTEFTLSEANVFAMTIMESYDELVRANS